MPDPDTRATWNSHDLEAVAACPVCAASARHLRHQHLHDRLEDVPGDWNLRDCSDCGSLFLDPRPTRQSIGKAYASYYTHGSGSAAHAADNGASWFWKLANGYMNARYGSQRRPALAAGRRLVPLAPPLRQQLDFFYRRLPPQPGRLLDVGCGNGSFLLRAREAGWQVAGLEPDPVAVDTAREAGLAVTKGTLDDFDASEHFDVITASHVIEHVHDPRQFLAQIAAQLQPGGMLWLATPNVDSPGHRWYGRAWRGLEPPRHLTVFSAKALRRLLTEAGFEAIRFHRRGRGARYILEVSHQLAARTPPKKSRLPPWLVDLAATVRATAGEELVVTAKRAS